MAFGAGRARERLRDGFLSRLSASAVADAFAVRGGMLVRSWAPDGGRRVGDLDLVCRAPVDARAMRAHARAILACELRDGVTFDAERFRVDRVWPEHGPHGFKLFAAGAVDGAPAEMTVDVSLGLDIWPVATRGTLGEASLWLCPHELVVGTKLRVIGELAAREWRPKDLADIRLALRRFSVSARLGESLERCHARPAVLSARWWDEPRTAARWDRYAARAPHISESLGAVLGEVRARLASFGSHARQP